MSTDLFKYIFEESKKDGCKGVISVIMKMAAFFICLSPVFIYFLLYQPVVVKEYNIVISSTLILGCGSVLFFVILSCSKVFSLIILSGKLKKDKSFTDGECEHYYFEKSFIIATVFQGILSMLLIFSYYYSNPSYLSNKQFKELFIVIIVIILYVAISLCVWIKFLLTYIKTLENKNELKSEIDITVNEKTIDDLIKVLESYKKNIGNL